MLPSTLRHGAREYRVLGPRDPGPSESAVPFGGGLSARDFVERLLFNPDNERALRSVLREHGGLWAGERGITDEIARLLWSGEIRIEEVPRENLAGAAVAPAEEIPARTASPARETAWVEFVVVDDATGDPVPDVKLGITLPRQKRADRTTPGSGSIDIDPCAPGSCAIDTDIEGATLGSTLELVGIGEPSRAPVDGIPFPKADGKPFKLARVERHRVRTGETLASIAERAGMSWQDLARFNFGTDDPKQINRALRAQVGCFRRTEDRKNYVFDDADDPGIVYVPRRVEERGLPTGRTHTLRVRRLARPIRPFLLSW